MISDNMDFVDEFESKLAEYTGSKYAVCTDCCTNAVLISLFLKKSFFGTSNSIGVPNRTYMSIPMTLRWFGFDVRLENRDWEEYYSINDIITGESTGVVDAAVFFKEGMWNEIDIPEKLVCLSFQQKKRLSLGRGGAILTDSEYFHSILKRMVYDGRNPRIPDSVEIENNPNDITTLSRGVFDGARQGRSRDIGVESIKHIEGIQENHIFRLPRPKPNTMNIALIAPIERNIECLNKQTGIVRFPRMYEDEAIRCFSSWRKSGGWLKDIPIHVLCSTGNGISDCTKKKLANLGVEYVERYADETKTYSSGFLTLPYCGAGCSSIQ